MSPRGVALTAWLVAACALLQGCATSLPGQVLRRAADMAKPATPVPSELVLAGVKPGVSTVEDVRAALGETTRARFDSGYEVWAYRFAVPQDKGSDKKSGEFVVLIAPSGRVAKTRLTTPPPPPPPSPPA